MIDENDQRDWWENVYLPLVRKALRGEHVHPWLLAGGMLEESDDHKWDKQIDVWWID
jgi:hypothetical protein